MDRERLARLPGHPPPDAPLVCLDTETTGLATAAGTLAFLVGLARWDGTWFHQVQLLLPDHADEPALLAEIARWVTPDTWLVTYNGRGFDWPLIEARFRLAGRPAPAHAGHLDLLPFVRRVFKHRMEDARLRTVEGELLGVSRVGDVEGWEIPSIYLDVLRGGPVEPLAGVVIHNEKDVRSLGLLLAHVEHRYADRDDAPRGAARRPRGPRRGLHPRPAARRGARVPGRCARRGAAGAGPVRAVAGGRRPSRARPPRTSATRGGRRGSGRTSAGRRPAAGWRGARERPRRAARARRRARRPGTPDARWTDERRRGGAGPRRCAASGRWAEAAEAWQVAAAAGGGLGVIAWIEVAKLREHRLGDPGGALAATRAAWRLLERLRVTGRAHPRLEADLQRRGVRLAARVRADAGRVAVGRSSSVAQHPAPRGLARCGHARTRPGPRGSATRTPRRTGGPGPGRRSRP